MSDAFIREVDEDLRQKQLSNIWKKYGKFVIASAIAIVLVVAGRGIYGYVVESRYNEQANAFGEALMLSGDEQSNALEAIISSDVDGYEIVAAFKKAELALVNDDRDGAIATLDQFIANSSVPDLYKNMANIQATLIEMDTASVDKIRGRLALIMDGESTFRFLATELLALSEIRNGDATAAKTRLEALVGDVETPASVKNRAEQYISVMEE